MTKDDGNLNDEAQMELRFRHWGFVINSSFVIRASSFPRLVIPHSSFF